MQRLLIYNCCPLGNNEIELWNAFQQTVKGSYELIFFTNNVRSDLEIPSVIEIGYDQKLFNFELPSELQELEEKIALIASKDKIWERFDQQQSFRKALSWYLFWIATIHSLEPVGVYVWSGYEVIADALSHAARDAGITPLILERGPLAKTFACDSLGVNFASSFIQSYISSPTVADHDRVERFARLYYETGVSNWDQPKVINDKQAFRKLLGIPEGKIVIFFPSQVDTDTNVKLFSQHFPTVYSAFEAVAEELRLLSKEDVFLLGKKHPCQRVDEEQFEIALKGIGLWVAEANIFDCIRFSDAVISINSSTATEAALIGKPVLLLGQSILSPNRHVISLTDRSELSVKCHELIKLARSNTRAIDHNYYERLLFGYLFSADSEYIDLGVRPVKDIPLPVTNVSNMPCLPVSDINQRAILYYCRQILQVSRDHKHTAEQIERMVTEIKLYLHQIDQMATVIEALTNAVRGYQNSLSWKITTPLRWLRQKLAI